LTNKCTARYLSNHIVKFAGETAVVGLISNNVYKQQVEKLVDWYRAKSLYQYYKEEMVVEYTLLSLLEEQLWRWCTP